MCPSNSLLSLSGGSNTCSLHISTVTRHMHGSWMCLLNEISQFNSVKDSIMVEVAVPTVVMWGDGIHSDLHITEGGE